MNPATCINRGEIVISLHTLVLADRIKLYSQQPVNFSLFQEDLTFIAELTLLAKCNLYAYNIW